MFDQTPRQSVSTAATPGKTRRRPRVVIVGAGFGGVAAAKGLAGADVDVTLIDRRNYHLFQPLLYPVATAGLSPAQIAAPIRSLFAHAPNVRVVMARASGVDSHHREVRLEAGEPVPYDTLVLATGARHSYFGRDEWEKWRRASRRSTTPRKSAAAS